MLAAEQDFGPTLTLAPVLDEDQFPCHIGQPTIPSRNRTDIRGIAPRTIILP